MLIITADSIRLPFLAGVVDTRLPANVRLHEEVESDAKRSLERWSIIRYHGGVSLRRRGLVRRNADSFIAA